MHVSGLKKELNQQPDKKFKLFNAVILSLLIALQFVIQLNHFQNKRLQN